TSVASMSGGTCACKDTTTYWNGQACESCGANKVYENGSCVCNNQSYADGDSCIQCPSGSTPISGGCDCDGDGNWNGSSCITCDTNATFTDNVCKCNNGYYGTGTSCTECKKPFQTFENNTVCRCPDGTHEEEGRCEPNDDGSGGVTNLCEAGWVWDSTLGECVTNSCSNTESCPYGYVCDITDGQCIKDWECSNPHALDIIETECLACANRVWSEAGKCVVCPSNQVRLETGLCGCQNACPKNQSQNSETCACYCDETRYEEVPNQNDECICKTENVLVLDLMSDAQNSGGMDCKISVADLGYLNGTYYFEWVNGFHYYECESRHVGFSVFLFADNTNLGYILNVDKPESHYVCYYQDSISLESALKNNPIKYFSFDGSQKITLQFWDDHCYDNCGSMNFKLHKIIDYCMTNSCSNSSMCEEGHVCDLTDGICINNWDCNNSHTLDIPQEECLICDNRGWTENEKCMVCSSNQQPINGVCSCPELQLLNDNTCVDSCPSDKSYIYLRNCVSECPSDKPVPDVNKICQTCAEIDSTKPIWDASTKVCESCIEGTVWNGTECIDLSTMCANQLENIGLTSYNASGDTITYNTNMTVANDLDISKCNLIVNGTLTVNSGITLKVKNVSATSSSANGINNSGTITATQTVYGKGYSYGIDNKSSGTINANKLDAGQIQSNNAETTTDFLAAIVNYGTINSNVVMCSRDVGINKYTINIGVKNYGKIFADDILGVGYFSQVATVKASTQANNIDVYLCETWADSILVVNDILRTDSLLNAGAISVKKVQTKRADLYNGSVDAEIFSVTEILNNYSTLSANLVYGGDIISQEYTSGMITFGPGKMTAPKIYYCTSYKYGTYSTTPIKKCAETCSGSTPIWNGESCEACPSIRPNWNAEYGICE
ncbi:MAG: hypothetical protein IJO11_05070, partial [Alphaproteobacteria bacterium]|nr:hypothetical protein [Alphaproteobacteria bacterium]